MLYYVTNFTPSGTRSDAALAIRLGAGERSLRKGCELLAARQRPVRGYVQRLRVAGFGVHCEHARPGSAGGRVGGAMAGAAT